MCVHTVRYQEKLTFGNADNVFEPAIEVLRHSNHLFRSERKRPAGQIPPLVHTSRVSHIAPMLAMEQNCARRETGCEDAIEGSPVASVDNVDVCTSEQFVEFEQQTNIIAFTFVQFVIFHWPL